MDVDGMHVHCEVDDTPNLHGPRSRPDSGWSRPGEAFHVGVDGIPGCQALSFGQGDQPPKSSIDCSGGVDCRNLVEHSWYLGQRSVCPSRLVDHKFHHFPSVAVSLVSARIGGCGVVTEKNSGIHREGGEVHKDLGALPRTHPIALQRHWTVEVALVRSDDLEGQLVKRCLRCGVEHPKLESEKSGVGAVKDSESVHSWLHVHVRPHLWGERGCGWMRMSDQNILG